MTTELNANQQFHLAYATKDADTVKYGGRPSGRCLMMSDSQKAIMARVAKRGYGKLERDTGWSYFVPDEKCREHLRRYKPDTPERQVMLWDLKAPQLRTLCKFINEHLGDKYEASLRNTLFQPSHNLPGTRIRSVGKMREGKELEVWPKRYQDRERYPEVRVVGPDPDDRNEKVVEWLKRVMGVKRP